MCSWFDVVLSAEGGDGGEDEVELSRTLQRQNGTPHSANEGESEAALAWTSGKEKFGETVGGYKSGLMVFILQTSSHITIICLLIVSVKMAVEVNTNDNNYLIS